MAGTVVVERTERISASPEQLLPHIARLPEWTQWSPWEDLDPDLQREYTGEPGAVGSTYAWSGNRKAGSGTMRVTAVDPDGVGIHLEFTRPFRSSNELRFVLTPEGDATRVIWRMETPRKLYTRFVNLDKLIGGDFEKGLRKLKQVAETP
ncbi:SRPBCC family protein [Leifsonia sp. NPDC077715]|uniref:SRPBCC family protein n=1 Tax=Leifsonia sp. NPDC077715 TaxID=3155539 RepID=UPI00343529A2